MTERHDHATSASSVPHGDPTSRPRASGEASPPELDGIVHRFLELPGLRIHIAEAGVGEPVLLLHGFPQHWWEWRGVVPVLAGAGYHVLAVDLRGCGWTDAPTGRYDAAVHVADTVALLDATGVGRAHVVSHDWGAIVGLRLAMEQPDRVSSLLTIGVPHPWMRFRPQMIGAMRHAWFQPLVACRPLGSRLLGRGRQRLVRHLFRAFSGGRLTGEEIEPYLERLRDPDRARAGSALYRELIMPTFTAVLSGAFRGRRLAMPTLVLLAEGDVLSDPSLLAGHEEHADDLTVEVLPGASHFVVDEEPTVVAARALRFLTRT